MMKTITMQERERFLKRQENRGSEVLIMAKKADEDINQTKLTEVINK